MIELPWVAAARESIGVREIPGKETAPEIVKMLITLKAWWRDDETPWCGVGQAYWMKQAGLPYPSKYYRALEWSKYGIKLDRPAYGSIVVFSRSGGGHVGTIVGKDEKGRLMVLGANQKNMVSIAPFDRERVVAYRYPENMLPPNYELPLLKSDAKSSANEA
jgi:uncharacterized protein (TIGR02594 family)